MGIARGEGKKLSAGPGRFHSSPAGSSSLLTEHRKLRTGTPLWLDRPLPPIASAALARDASAGVLVIGTGVTGALVAELQSRDHA